MCVKIVYKNISSIDSIYKQKLIDCFTEKYEKKILENFLKNISQSFNALNKKN